MCNKRELFSLIIFLIINTQLQSMPIDGKENEIIIGKIIFREYYLTNSNIQLNNQYFVIFENPWETEIFGRDFIFYEILIKNDITEYLMGIDYENNLFRIYCSINPDLIPSDDENIDFIAVLAIFVNKIEIIN
jgi:hypothetical protein